MEFRCVRPNEYKSLSAIHMQAFDDFFLTTLGVDFLKTYYRSVLRNKDSITVCSVNEMGELVGFATGSRLSIGYNRRLLLENWAYFLKIMPRLMITRPRSIVRLMRNLDKKAHPEDDGRYAELLSIAVLPSVKRNGIGRSLLALFESKAEEMGCTRVALTTDRYNNEPVVSFYKKNGYQIFYEFVTYPNRSMYKLIKKLASN